MENKNMGCWDLVQYFLVNQELNMSTGKVAAQVSHASTLLALQEKSMYEKIIYKRWLNDIKRVVVLKADSEKMNQLHILFPKSIKIIDKGFTEIEPNSFTVLGLPIMAKEYGRDFVGDLKLYK